MYYDYQYQFGDISLISIRNRNETRIIKCLSNILPEYADFKPNRLDIEDIYCLSLNKLTARYTPQASVVLNEPVKDKDIENVVREAIKTVRKRPNH